MYQSSSGEGREKDRRLDRTGNLGTTLSRRRLWGWVGWRITVTLFFANTTDANAKETEDEVYLLQAAADWSKGEEHGGQEDEA